MAGTDAQLLTSPHENSSGRSKLRASCDSCAVAKVKCDRRQPICERCAVNSFSCSYSPSRRRGKQPWARNPASERNPRLPHQSTNSTTHDTEVMSTSHAPSPFHLPTKSTTDDSSGSGPGSTSFTPASSGPTPSNHIDVDMINPFDGNGNAALQGFDAFDGGLDFLPNWTWDGSPNGLDFMGSHPNDAHGSLHSNNHGLTSALPSEEQHTPSATASSSRFAIHDCEGKALKTLNSLHFCTMVHVDRPGAPTETTLGNISALMPPLDKVLYFNRAALNTLRKCYECRCGGLSHIGMLYSAVLSKVLFWYQLIASPNYHLAETSKDTPATAPREIVPGCPGVPQIIDRMVATTHVKIGVFDLEEADQVALIRTVLLREVVKVEDILDKWKVLCKQTGGTWYDFVSAKLREEFRETTQKIKDFGRDGGGPS